MPADRRPEDRPSRRAPVRCAEPEYRFTFRCAECGVIAHGFSRPPAVAPPRFDPDRLLPAGWERRRLAAVTAAFTSCPACAGRARAGLLRVAYWYLRLVVGVAGRALGFAALAYLAAPHLPEDWARPATGGLVVLALTLAGVFWAGLAGGRYVAAMRAAEGCVRYD